MDEFVKFERYDDVAVITLNRPERLNALGSEVRRDLDRAVATFTDDDTLRVAVLTGEGRAFSAGADLKELAVRRQGTRPRLNTTFEQSQQFSRNPKPFIAAINGICIGGGLERALDCDIRLCSSSAVFGLFEVKRGIIAGYAVHHLVRLVPFGDAMRFLLSGDEFGAEEALRLGLVSAVCEPDALMSEAIALARRIAANAPLAVEGSKAIAQQWRLLQVDESYRAAEWVIRKVFGSDDSLEGPMAFNEKRAPNWTGR